MWQTIKAKATSVLAFLAFPLLATAWFLLQRIQGLKNQVALEQTKEQMAQALAKVAETQQEATKDEKSFNDMVTDYARSNPKPSSPTDPDSAA